jgi:ribonuclease HII
LTIEQKTIIDGDADVNAIAAASIIAKVTRDDIIFEYAKKYPEYSFKSNKGYGTAEHIAALEKYGSSPIHRKSFGRVPE